MMETMLKSISPYETRFLITHLELIPSGLDVVKYIPLRAHYADKTILQVRAGQGLACLMASRAVAGTPANAGAYARIRVHSYAIWCRYGCSYGRGLGYL